MMDGEKWCDRIPEALLAHRHPAVDFIQKIKFLGLLTDNNIQALGISSYYAAGRVFDGPDQIKNLQNAWAWLIIREVLREDKGK